MTDSEPLQANRIGRCPAPHQHYRAGDKGDLTKKFDQVRVWYCLKGYLSGRMENGCWGVASGGIGHQRSFKVTTQRNLENKCDLIKNFVFRIIGKVSCLGL